MGIIIKGTTFIQITLEDLLGGVLKMKQMMKQKIRKIVDFLSDDEDLSFKALAIKGTLGAAFVYMWLILLASMGR